MSSHDFPRSAKYDPDWVLENLMGPNVLWLAEWLSGVLELRPGMRVLDLGCGRALSSIFLAKEFGVQVWATDLWVSASDNWRRIREAGVEESVYPIHAEAHDLPYAEEFFDVVVSLDAYHYFGTDDLYLGRHFLPRVKPGGQVAIVVPGLVAELATAPSRLAAIWAKEWELWSFHSPDWWRHHWAKTGLVDVEVADLMTDGWRHWVRSDELLLAHGFGNLPAELEPFAREFVAALNEDAGRTLGFARLVARRR